MSTAVWDANPADDQRVLFRVTDLVKRWSLGRSTIYQLLDSGTIRSVKIGASRRVPASAVAEFESRLAAKGNI